MDAVKLEPVASLSGHHDRVWSVAWAPQGDMLASCSGDKTVRIWSRRLAGNTSASSGGSSSSDAGQWYCSAILDQCHTRTIRSVAWSPTGRALATASFDATVAIWELSGGMWEQVAELEGHENEVKCVAWNPDGRLIATCGRDRSVWIWESMPGREFECVDVKQGHSQDVKTVCWHPGGELLVSAGYDDTIRLWTYDGDEWGCSQTLGGSGAQGHESTVWDVCWDPSGQRLASCSDDLTVRIWESRSASRSSNSKAGPTDEAGGGVGGAAAGGGGFVPTRPDLRCATTLSGYHARTVFSLDWSSAGLLATGDGDDHILLFGQGEPELLLPHILQDGGGTAEGAGAATDLAGGDSGSAGPQGGEAQRVEPGAQAQGQEGAFGVSGPWSLWAKCSGAHGADVNCVRWNPRQHRLLASCGDDNLVKLWWLGAGGLGRGQG